MNQPHKSECPVAAGQDAENQNTNGIDFPTDERKSKAISTIRAQLASHGHELTVMYCSDFLVHTNDKTLYVKDTETLQALAKRLGARK